MNDENSLGAVVTDRFQDVVNACDVEDFPRAFAACQALLVAVDEYNAIQSMVCSDPLLEALDEVEDSFSADEYQQIADLFGF